MPDEVCMRRCLELAEGGRGKVGNGALVGAVLVRPTEQTGMERGGGNANDVHGEILAEAYHEGFGTLHAERKLLETYPDHIAPEDILYVNLEPCCHHGKTPPCVDLLLQRGVRRVVVGTPDPDPRVGGEGISRLRAAGVDVRGPVLRAECERCNRGFLTLRTKGRLWITLKSAQTHEGSIAHPDGSPLKITSPKQDIWSHTALRAKMDAILVGVGTVIADDPRLDTRLVKSNKKVDQEIPQPYRIILDPKLRIPLNARVVSDGGRSRTIIVTDAATREPKKAEDLLHRGVRLFDVPTSGGLFRWDALFAALSTPLDDFSGITNVLIEGGRRTWGAFREGGYLDEEVVLAAGDAA